MKNCSAAFLVAMNHLLLLIVASDELLPHDKKEVIGTSCSRIFCFSCIVRDLTFNFYSNSVFLLLEGTKFHYRIAEVSR